MPQPLYLWAIIPGCPSVRRLSWFQGWSERERWSRPQISFPTGNRIAVFQPVVRQHNDTDRDNYEASYRTSRLIGRYK